VFVSRRGWVHVIPGKHVTTTSHHIVKAVAGLQALIDPADV